MPYIHFTEDQKLRANSVDLVEFLRRQGEKLISSGQEKRLTSDHSITLAIVLGQYALELHGDLIRPVLEDTPVLMRQDVAF